MKFKEVKKYYPEGEYLEIGIDYDRIHLHMIVLSKYSVSRVVETIKTNSSSEAILKLYNNLVLRDNMGRNGRAYAVKYFSRQVCVKKYEKLFLKAFRRSKGI